MPNWSDDTFTAGEIPSTAKWNKLWDNDEHFHDFLVDGIENFIVSGGVSPTSASLASTRTALVAYITGVKVSISATAKTYTASKETYVDLGADGVYDYTEITVGGTAPALAANHIRVEIVTTSGTAVTAVQSTGLDRLGNDVGPKLLRNRPWTAYTNTGTGAGTVNYIRIGKTVYAYGRSNNGGSVASGGVFAFQIVWLAGIFGTAPETTAIPAELTTNADQQIYEPAAATNLLTQLSLRNASAVTVTGKVAWHAFGKTVL